MWRRQRRQNCQDNSEVIRPDWWWYQVLLLPLNPLVWDYGCSDCWPLDFQAIRRRWTIFLSEKYKILHGQSWLLGPSSKYRYWELSILQNIQVVVFLFLCFSQFVNIFLCHPDLHLVYIVMIIFNFTEMLSKVSSLRRRKQFRPEI